MATVETLCLIPAKLLHKLKTHPVLDKIFNHVDDQSYNNMMVKILGNIITDETSTYFHKRHMQISREQADAWMDCFNRTLYELQISPDQSKDVSHRMEKAVYHMHETTPSHHLCNSIYECFSNSNDPEKLLHDVSEYVHDLQKNPMTRIPHIQHWYQG